MNARRMFRSGVSAICLTSSVLWAQAALQNQPTALDQSARLQTVAGGLEDAFTKFAGQISNKDPNADVRGLAAYAFYRAVAHKDGPGAEQAMRMILTQQDMRTDSPTYGEVPWNVFNANIKDANAIEFGTHFWGPLMLGYGDVLSPAFVKDMHPHAEAALAALERHHPPVSYTNIFLMNTDATILLSQFAGDKAQAERGKTQLAEWMLYTSKHGIPEFDSPTYTSEDLNDLSMCLRYTSDPEEHAELAAALDYLWKDIALNVSPTMHYPLLGAHSRDYDFLGKTGSLMMLEWVNGLRDDFHFTATDPSKVGVLDYIQPKGFLLDGAKLRSLIPDTRVVTQRFGEKDTEIRYTYVTPGFSVGTASGDHGPQDRMYAVYFANEKDLPGIGIEPDPYDAPYGLPEQQSKDSSGHTKPNHLPLHPLFLQKNGSVLAMLDLDLTDAKIKNSMATDIILPAKADEVRLKDKLVDVNKLSSLDAAPNDTVGIRVGTSCHAFRFVHVDPVSGKAPVFQMKAEDLPRSKGAFRFVVYHFQKATSNAPKNLRVVMLSETANCPAGGLQEFMNKVAQEKASFDRKDGRVVVHASTANGEFAMSVRDDARSGTWTIDGVTPTSAPLAFNGEAIPLQAVPATR